VDVVEVEAEEGVVDEATEEEEAVGETTKDEQLQISNLTLVVSL